MSVENRVRHTRLSGSDGLLTNRTERRRATSVRPDGGDIYNQDAQLRLTALAVLLCVALVGTRSPLQVELFTSRWKPAAETAYFHHFGQTDVAVEPSLTGGHMWKWVRALNCMTQTSEKLCSHG